MTLAEMQREVYDLMGLTQPPWPIALRVKRSLIQAHLRVIAEEKLNHARADLAFVANDPDVALPADFLEIRSVRRDEKVLEMWDDEGLARWRAGEVTSGTATDAPYAFMMKEPNRITIFPTPTTSDSTGLDLYYVAKITKMALDADEPAGLPEPWHELLVQMVVAKLGPADRRREAKQDVAELRGSLHAHVADRMGDGPFRIRLRGFIGRA